jgi:RNA polymerase sigma-70 factor (ECF subfamily)
MGDAPLTRPSLLLRVRDPGDAEAWREFVDLYGPLVYRFVRKRGLQDADAVDLVQIVLEELTREVRRLNYDPRRGSFRGWLFAVVRNQLSNFYHRGRRGPAGTGDTAAHQLLREQPDRQQDESVIWNREHERRMFEWAAAKVRGQFQEASWQAFWQTAVEGRGAKEVAEELGMSVGAIYTAKSRVLDRVKSEIQQLLGEEESVSD